MIGKVQSSDMSICGLYFLEYGPRGTHNPVISCNERFYEKEIISLRYIFRVERCFRILRQSEQIDGIGIESVILSNGQRESNGKIPIFADRYHIFAEIEYGLRIVTVRFVVYKNTVGCREYVHIDNTERLHKTLPGNILEIFTGYLPCFDTEQTFIIRIVSLKKEKKEYGHNENNYPKNTVFVSAYSKFFVIGRDHNGKL